MVLLRRKVVEVQNPDHEPPEDAEVWYIPTTQEYFEEYDEFLARMDFYNQKKFICELTGHSCLTYFEALESEMRETEQVMNSFPEALKEPILRKVQFSQITRLDALVDYVYNSLRSEFYPGEVAIARVRDQRVKVVIREKAKFSSITLPNGEVQPPYSRYRVEMVGNPGQELAVDESQLVRDRRVFTKFILRTFIKHAVARENWTGAPWLVKDEYARIYRIDQNIPPHLLRAKQTPINEKEKKLRPKEAISVKPSPTPEEVKTTPKKKRGGAAAATPISTGDHAANGSAPTAKQTASRDEKSRGSQEDLELQMDPALKRNQLKWEQSIGREDYRRLIGKLLEIWVFMNVYHEPLLLDPFTFDDFLDALRLSDQTVDCSLLNEMHCALLSILVDLDEAEFAIPLPPDEEDILHVNGNGVHTSDKQNNEDDSDSNASPLPPPPPRNKAVAFLTYQNSDWKERLRKRMFKDGGWQQILIGVLHTVSYVEEWTDVCNAALDELASLDRPVALFAAYEGYYNLSFSLRVSILGILCDLVTGSNVVRSYMDKCMEEISRIKRERLERQREYRSLQDQLKAVEEEKRQFLHIDKKRSKESKDSKHSKESKSKDSKDAIDPKDSKYSKKTGNSDIKREEETDLEDGPRAEAELAEESPVLQKIIESIDALNAKIGYIEEINKQQEDELSRLDCQRLRLLGKDRYYNRYWWFEGNGFKRVPTNEKDDKGKTDSDKDEDVEESGDDITEDAPAIDYSMGRLWVQGPSDEDLYTFLGWTAELETLKRENKLGAYISGFDGRILIDVYGHPVSHMLPMERKRLEEMDMFLSSTDDWGYYDTKEDIQALIAWLNPFGKRESALRKEILRVLPWMEASMQSRQEDLRADEEKRIRAIDLQVEAEVESRLDAADADARGSQDEHAIDSSDDGPRRRRRSSRLNGASSPSQGSRKRRKLNAAAEPDHQELIRKKEERRQELMKEVFNQLSNRVLEWANTLAIEKLGHSHYDTQRKRGPKAKKPKV